MINVTPNPTSSKNKSVFIAGLCGVLVVGWLLSAQQTSNAQYEVSFATSVNNDLVFSARGRGGNDLYVMNLGTFNIKQLTESADYETKPTFSPDGRWIVYTARSEPDQSQHIFLTSVDGTVKKQLTSDDSFFNDNPAFSPDGKRIVFGRAYRNRPYSRGGNTVWDHLEICVLTLSSNAVQRVTNQNYSAIESPRFKPDGRTVIFSAPQVNKLQADGPARIWAVRTDANKPPQSLCIADGVLTDVSSDGKYLLLVSDRLKAFNFEAFRVNSDGTNPTQVTWDRIDPANAVFTKDGKHIVFDSFSESAQSAYWRTELWQADVDGKNPKRIADKTLFDDPLNWRPPSG